MKSKITARFVMLIVTAAVAPLAVYGAVSISSLRSGSRQAVIDGNLNVARQAAARVDLYMGSNIRILHSLAAELRQTRLRDWQVDRVLKNYVLDFPEFREITLFDALGQVLATSRVGTPGVRVPNDAPPGTEAHLEPVTVDNDFLPTTTVTIRSRQPNRADTWLVGEVSLEELWRMVNGIRVGSEGFAALVAENGQLIAHGNPDERARVAAGDDLSTHELVARIEAWRSPEGYFELERAPAGAEASPTFGSEYPDSMGRLLLGVAAPVQGTGWIVFVEQPTSEAYQLANRIQLELFGIISLALLATVGIGYYWGRSFIRPIRALMRGTRSIAAGRLEERVSIAGTDEFHQLGEAFNSMADKLVELQDDVRKQERQAMFGRVAAGLAHDISHPIQNIGNSCKLIVKLFDDAEYRDTFRRTVEREFATIKRVIEDLRNLARPMPLEHFPVDVNRSVADALESIQPLAESAGVTLDASLSPENPYVIGDMFALGRVYRNLLLNAIEATSPGGAIIISTEHRPETVRVSIADTGLGIAPERLSAIFEDFSTTKRRGLGLGLAISKKIVEQLDGTIAVDSEVGQGTTFALELPQTARRPFPAAVVAS